MIGQRIDFLLQAMISHSLYLAHIPRGTIKFEFMIKIACSLFIRLEASEIL